MVVAYAPYQVETCSMDSTGMTDEQRIAAMEYLVARNNLEMADLMVQAERARWKAAQAAWRRIYRTEERALHRLENVLGREILGDEESGKTPISVNPEWTMEAATGRPFVPHRIRATKKGAE